MTDGQQDVVFLTIHDPESIGDRVQNPWSALVIEALQAGGSEILIVSAVKEVKRVAMRGRMLIPLFDQHYGINWWSPCNKRMSLIPYWVKAFISVDLDPTIVCSFATGRQGVQSPIRVKHVAVQIQTIVSDLYGSSEIGESSKWLRSKSPIAGRSTRSWRKVRPPEPRWLK
jgi:hypothetical protein